jgi:molybdopterin-guanine dinucleotide biosynthesis protein A
MSQTGRADAVIIAGGTIGKADMRELVGVDTRAEIDMLGKPMLEWTARAVREAQDIGRIAVVGDPEVLAPIAGEVADAIVEEGVDEVDNLFRGLDALPGATRVAMLAGDIPLLTPEAVDDLVANAPADTDVVFPICRDEDVLRDFPDRNWTLVKTPDGSFTGGCGFLFEPEAVRARRDWVQEVFDSRRSPWKLMRIWGLWFGAMALLHQVSVAEAEAKVSEVLGLRARAYITRYTELCLDLDYAEDVEQVRKHLAARQKAGD